MTYAGIQMLMEKLNQLINYNYNHNPLFINNPTIISQRPQFQLLYQDLASMIQLQMLMEKLNQLINYNHINPLFINNPTIISERPQFQLLYQELGSMIQALFIDQHQDLYDIEKVNDLKQRFADAAEEAQYIIDLFLSEVHLTNKTEDSPTSEDLNPSLYLDDVRRSLIDLFLCCFQIRENEHFPTSGDLKRSLNLNLDDVTRSFRSIEEEFMTMSIDSTKMDSSPNPRRMLDQSVAGQTSISRNSLRPKNVFDEIFVGLDGDAKLVEDKIMENGTNLDIVSIVGAGGIGKTTLATKVFNDRYVKHHFYVRVWVTVSQTYDKRAVWTQILESIRVQLNPKKDSETALHEKEDTDLDLEKVSDSKLSEFVYKNLKYKRYLIVIDDLWQIETWDNLELFFPNDNNGSRILLTSRLAEVAKHANRKNPDALVHRLGYLNKERSWELLCQKVFQGDECPEWSIKPGMQIAESCQGLPLAVVVIAGVIAKEAWSEKFWVEIADKTRSYIVGEENGCMETLALSYSHLPLHLRECFLYLGGFPEDYEFRVQWLMRLWEAEGFIQKDGNRSLEDIAEDYLMDLINRNLVIVANRSKSDGTIKACKVHDLVRELCLRKAKEEQFILITELSPQFPDNITQPYKSVRIFINKDVNIIGFPYSPVENLRTILCFSDFRSLSDVIANGFCSFQLLRVLNLQECKVKSLPKEMGWLVHLKYLAIYVKKRFPSSICNLWSLQTLIYKMGTLCTVLPSNISDLVNLRHMWTNKYFAFPSIEKPMKNLQSIHGVELETWGDTFIKSVPYIKELICFASSEKKNDFQSLTYLEKLKVTGLDVNHITFPASLKSLTISNCGLPCSEMSIIQSLPNLQVLKLKYDAFKGSCWKVDEQGFPKLKFLRLNSIDIQEWEVHMTSLQCLQQLEIINCDHLKKIPSEIGDLPSLELIKVWGCSYSVVESATTIQEEQHYWGNINLKLDIFGLWGRYVS